MTTKTTRSDREPATQRAAKAITTARKRTPTGVQNPIETRTPDREEGGWRRRRAEHNATPSSRTAAPASRGGVTRPPPKRNLPAGMSTRTGKKRSLRTPPRVDRKLIFRSPRGAGGRAASDPVARRTDRNKHPLRIHLQTAKSERKSEAGTLPYTPPGPPDSLQANTLKRQSSHKSRVSVNCPRRGSTRSLQFNVPPRSPRGAVQVPYLLNPYPFMVMSRRCRPAPECPSAGTLRAPGMFGTPYISAFHAKCPQPYPGCGSTAPTQSGLGATPNGVDKKTDFCGLPAE